MSSRLQGILPVVLSISFVLIIISLSVLKLITFSGAMLICGVSIVIGYLIWLVVEGKVAVKELDKYATRKDRGTLEIYAAGRLITVVSALGLETAWKGQQIVPAIGVALFIVGIVFRLVAIRTLGEFYSHRVRVVKEHRIIKHGPYRFVCHPAYTGMILAHLGFVLFFFNWVSLAVLLGVFIPSIILRVAVEEKAMFEIDGYADYVKSHKRLLPLVW